MVENCVTFQDGLKFETLKRYLSTKHQNSLILLPEKHCWSLSFTCSPSLFTNFFNQLTMSRVVFVWVFWESHLIWYFFFMKTTHLRVENLTDSDFIHPLEMGRKLNYLLRKLVFVCKKLTWELKSWRSVISYMLLKMGRKCNRLVNQDFKFKTI